MAVNKLYLFIFKHKYKHIKRILCTETNTSISPLSIKHSDTCFYIIILPKAVSSFKCRKSSMWLCIMKSHLLHIMLPTILRNNPRSTLTIISVIAHRVIPFSIIPWILHKMILSHCRMILIIWELSYWKILKIFFEQIYTLHNNSSIHLIKTAHIPL